MRKKIFLIIGIITLLIGCSKKERDNKIDVGINETMQVIMDKQEELGNTRYDYLSDDDETDFIEIEFLTLKNVGILGEEVETLAYGFERDNDEYIVKMVAYDLKDSAEDESERYHKIMKKLTLEYGEPLEQESENELAMPEDIDVELLGGVFKDENVIVSYSRFGNYIMFQEVDSIIEQTKNNAVKHAPEFTLRQINPNVDLDEITLSDFQGELVVLNFFATFAQPSEEEVPTLNRLAEVYDDVAFIAISLDTTELVVERFVDKYDLTIPIVRDDEGELLDMDSYGIGPIPTTFVIDKEGRIIEEFQGQMSEEEIEKLKGVIK